MLLARATGASISQAKRADKSVSATLAAALRRPGAKAAAALDGALILCAEHELTASTFAARIAASTGAGLWACLATGLATLSGPRHGAAGEQVAGFVRGLGSLTPTSARAIVLETLRQREALPGFGHPLYPGGDPRGAALLAIARDLDRTSGRTAVRSFDLLAAAAHAATGEHPTLDFGLAALAAALDLPPEATTAIFAVGRTAGLIAHVLEQRADGRLLRPRARYVGTTVE
jgi:citrate synthase